MTKFEEVYLLSSLISIAKEDGSIDLNSTDKWSNLLFDNNTKIQEDYFLNLNKKGFLNYEEIGDDGFKPIVICSINPNTKTYFKQLITEIQICDSLKQSQIDLLNKRIHEILTFDLNRLSKEIQSTEKIIKETKDQISSNPILHALSKQLNEIEIHFNSLSKVANNYEEIYKNIILPVKEEGKSGIRQTVKWAIISIAISTIISIILTWFAGKP